MFDSTRCPHCSGVELPISVESSGVRKRLAISVISHAIMLSDDDVVLAASAAIVIAVAAGEQRARRPRRFWIRPSILQGRKKYRAREFMKDLLLDEVDIRG